LEEIMGDIDDRARALWIKLVAISASCTRTSIPIQAHREIESALQREQDEAVGEAVHCPNCPDQGWYLGGAQDDPEQIQCEFCYTVENSVFSWRSKYDDIRKRAEKAEAAERAMRAPRGSGAGGWTLDLGYLTLISETMDADYKVGPEEIEAVLLAHEARAALQSQGNVIGS
jgi:hypothetical protein